MNAIIRKTLLEALELYTETYRKWLEARHCTEAEQQLATKNIDLAVQAY